MDVIDFISIISFVVVATITFCGLASKSEGLTVAGVFLLIVNIGIHASFQAGANWQANDCLSKYDLVPKDSTPQIP